MPKTIIQKLVMMRNNISLLILLLFLSSGVEVCGKKIKRDKQKTNDFLYAIKRMSKRRSEADFAIVKELLEANAVGKCLALICLFFVPNV